MGIGIVIGVLLAALAWFFWPGAGAATPASTRRDRPDVDEAELEAAERDVQEAQSEDSVRDWGPGTQKPLP